VPQTPHELKDLPCIRYRFWGGVLYRWEFERGGIEVEIEVAGRSRLNDQDLMVDAALDGAGLAYVFEGQVEKLIAKRKLVQVLEDWCPAYPGFFMYYPSRRQLPAALRAFVDFVKAERPASQP
jgi:DNA-binding transcriptional LysR family regulator